MPVSMNLPGMRYAKNRIKRQTVPFFGLNLSDNTKEGEMQGCENLSFLRFPYLSQRGERRKEGGFSAASAAFAWNGAQIVLEDGRLLRDGEELTTLSAGEKQFVVVNTKLVIWPDKVTVDLVNGQTQKMDQAATTAGRATFTADSIQVDQVPTITPRREVRRGVQRAYCYIRTYSSLSFKDGAWVKSGMKDKKIWEMRKGDLFIPYRTEAGDYLPNILGGESEYIETAPPYKYEDNLDGVYCAFAECTEDTIVEDKYSATGRYYFTYDTYREGVANRKWSEVFAVGDPVVISGCGGYPKNNKAHLRITGFDDTANKILFAAGTFAFDGEGSGWTDGPVTIQRDVPDLTYVCEKNNRLWGVSNAQTGQVWNEETGEYDEVTSRVIMASALGDPTNFWPTTGISTDAWQVAVASEGDFTAICGSGNGVLCWKENELCKVLGSTPEEYTLYTYRVPGVQKGSHKSLVNLNEVLYYKGTAGVYAYTGNTPVLVSSALGNHRFGGASAGTDGKNYYISMEEGGAYSLFCYDTDRGLWLREDGTQAADFCLLDGRMRFLSGGSLWEMDTLRPGNVPWSATFCPFYEQVHSRKSYTRLMIRAELKAGWLKVEVRTDGERWKQVAMRTRGGAFTLPIPLHRCDRFEVRLSGNGTCAIQSMEREFTLGKER